jgi:pimeloyl-ACP methyl ester carboxylesterase
MFIHSTGLGPFMWSKLLDGLPEGVAALTPANRGYSPTDLLARGMPFTLADEVAHLKAQIPSGTTGVHLVGHSYGGLVALTLAMDPAMPVRSLWLYEPVLFGSLHAEAETLEGEVARHVHEFSHDGEFLLNDDTGGNVAWLERFVDYWNQPGAWAAMGDKAKAMAQAVGWKMYQEVRTVWQQPQPFAHYRLSVPTTLVHGQNTQPPAADMVRRLAAVNPHAEVVALPGQGHMAVVGAPAAVWPSLQAHWARVVA